MAEWAKEGGHWYDRMGNPCYEVRRADGSAMRPTTLADAKKLNLLPGVTSIIGCAAKPGLQRWKEQQVLLAALTLPRKDNEPEADWIKRVFEDSEEQARKAAEKGTQIHAAIESYYRYREHMDLDYMQLVEKVVNTISKKYGNQDWLPEKSFTSPYGYGCKVDLVSDSVIIDFKTKEFSDTSKKLAWDEHALQLAANRIATFGVKEARLADRKCANVFISTSVPGLVHIHEWKEEELERAWLKFKALLDYWQADRNYRPVWK